MSCCKGFADTARAFTLLELLVSQAVALIVITGAVALLVPLVRGFHEQEGASEAQVRLRQASHVILRDAQGVGGAEGKAGNLFVLVSDGGVGHADQFRIFKRDQGLCSGGAEPGAMEISGTPSTTTTLMKLGGACPLQTEGNCTPSVLNGRKLLVAGADRSLPLKASAANVSSCTLAFTAANNQSAASEYNAIYGTAFTTLAQVLADIAPAGTPSRIIVGSTFEYRVANGAGYDRLERSVDGREFRSVVDNVYDLQVVRAFDIDQDGAIADDEWAVGGSLASASPSNFVGARISLVAYGKSAAGGLQTRPPTLVANRNLTTAPTGRRYRASSIFAAARNR